MLKLHISLDFMLLNNDLCTWLQNTYERILCAKSFLQQYFYFSVCATLHDNITFGTKLK